MSRPLLRLMPPPLDEFRGFLSREVLVQGDICSTSPPANATPSLSLPLSPSHFLIAIDLSLHLACDCRLREASDDSDSSDDNDNDLNGCGSSSDAILSDHEIFIAIATQAAYALAYLRAGTPSPILHRDLHTGKILLCEGNTIKITGFEFSLSLPMGKTEVECLCIVETGSSNINPLLLLGGGKLSDKTDVHSYGVVLFKILTGRKLIDIEDPVDPDVKQRFCESIEEEHVISFIDSSILPEADKGAVSCARLAQKCLNVQTLEERPEMKQVVLELQRIKGL
ncbi:hypothetical protein ACLOJK_005988 [Asimina triloba]